MDNYMPIRFRYNASTQAQAVLFAGIQTSLGFYARNNFAVLPYLVPQNQRTIHLPNLDYHTIPDYWERTKHVDDNDPRLAPDLLAEISSLLPRLDEKVQRDTIRHYEEEWKKVEPVFWEFVGSLIPNYADLFDLVAVDITDYGSVMSYTTLEGGRRSIHCHMRSDMGVGQIAEAVITVLVRFLSERDKLDIPWAGWESIADFLIYRLKDRGVFLDYKPTMKDLAQENRDLMSESENYLKKLGLFFVEPFVLYNHQIFFNHKNITSYFTESQYVLLDNFISSARLVLSYSQLGDILWKNEPEKFSLWAINKQVQRLRDKLVSLGASQDVLRSVKGRGYAFINKTEAGLTDL